MGIETILIILGWGVVVGVVFSSIGAAGGILTSFGMISLFGVVEPNSVKPMTQIVVLATALTFVPGYFRRSSLVFPLGVLLGVGGLLGAYAGSTLSTLYLSDMTTFRPLFGVLTLAIAVQILWKLYRSGTSPLASTGSSDRSPSGGVRLTSFSYKELSFQHGEDDYSVATWSPLLAGMVISMTAAIFGVGGGFLLVPYMASLLAMPMHIIPATTAIAIFMSLAVSISNFVALGAPLRGDLLLPLVIGAVLGALAGPTINRSMKNGWLQAILAVVVTGIGLKYLLQ